MKLINLVYILIFSLLFTACVERATEGSMESPVLLTLDVVHHGGVGSTDTDSSESIYQFTTATEGNYTFTVSSEYSLDDFGMGVNAKDLSRYYGGADDGEPLVVYLDAQTTYYLVVVGGAIVYFDLLITSSVTVNTSPAYPARLTIEQNLTTLLSADESSYYRFDVNESVNYSIVANGLSSESNLDFELYANDFYDTYVGSANSDNEYNESLNVYLENRRYNLKVRNYGDDVTFNLFIEKKQK